MSDLVPFTIDELRNMPKEARRLALERYRDWLVRSRVQDKKETVNLSRRVYCFKNPEKWKASYKKYREKNKERINLRRRQHYEKNKEKIKLYRKDYYQTHKKELDLYNKKYRKLKKKSLKTQKQNDKTKN